MAAFHGKSGTVHYAAGAQANVTSWSVDVTADTAESTAMGDTWKTYLSGFNDWTATVEINEDSTGPLVGTTAALTALGATAAAFILNDGENTYTGNGICTGFSVNTDANDVVKLTYNVQGSGVLARTET